MEAGRTEEQIISDMNSLLGTVADLKADMLRLLEDDRDVKCFQATQADSEKLAKAIYDIEESLGQVIDKAKSDVLPEVESRLSDYPNLLQQLRTAELIHQAISVINDIQCHMSALQANIKSGELFQCLDEVIVLDSLFQLDIQLAKEDIEVLGILRNLFISAKHSLLDSFLKLWNENVIFKDTIDNNRQVVCSLTVTNLTETPKLVRAFEVFKLYHAKVDRELADRLMNKLLQPAISRSDRLLECSLLNNQMELVLVDTGDTESQSMKPSPPSPTSLAQSLQAALTTLYDCLLCQPLDESGSARLIDRIRPLIEERLCTCIIDDCLRRTVPSNSQALAAYADCAEAVVGLEESLTTNGYVSRSVSRLGDFVHDIELIFAEQRLEKILQRGREIALQSPADSVRIDELASLTSSEGDDVDPLVEKYIGKGVFAFPVCSVSSSSCELLTLLRSLPAEAAGASADLLTRTAACCRQLLLLYRDVASVRHANELANIPQLAALYYNSCQYLAHSCNEIEHTCMAPLLKQAGQGDKISVCLVDVAAALREDGARVFYSQLLAQSQQLLQPLQQLQIGTADSSLEHNTLHCRQALFYIETLARVWLVLPAKLHRKALGNLSDRMLQSLIGFALKQEDFRSRDADDLVRLLNLVRDAILKVFASLPADPLQQQQQQRDSLDRYIPSWNRFVYLAKMLDSALVAFPDLWCDGKSPLASCFTDTEVKGLIKALFMNTEDRAYVLAKIK